MEVLPTAGPPPSLVDPPITTITVTAHGPATSAAAPAPAATRVAGPDGQPNGVPVPGTPAPTSPNVNPQTLANIQDYLDDKNYTQNPLNSYFQPAYHFRLFMTSDKDFLSAATSVQALRQSLEPGATGSAAIASVVLAETGITTYNITDVQIEMMVAPNARTRNTNETKFTITIAEPMGVGFLETFRASADALGIRNLHKAFYFLELNFVGYDESGNEVRPVSGPYGDYWLWRVQFVNIDVEFSAGGGIYKINAVPSSETALQDEVLRFQEYLTVGGSTIGEFASNLGQSLTSNWANRYGNDLVTYKVQVHPIDPKLSNRGGNRDPNAFKITAQDPERSPQQSFKLDQRGVPLGTFPPGTAITDALEAAFASSEDAQALMKDNPAQQMTDTSSTNVNSTNVREVIVYRYEFEVTYTAYEYYQGQYKRTITIHVQPYYTQYPILSSVQKVAARDSATQKTMFDLLYGKGFLNKKYEYLFTGLNTEILEFNVNMNLLWNAPLPKNDGPALDSQMTGKQARSNPNNDPAAQQGIKLITPLVAIQQLDDSQSQLAAASERITSSGLTLAATNQQIAAAQQNTPGDKDAISALQKQQTAVQDQVVDLIAQRSAARSNVQAAESRAALLNGVPAVQALGTSLQGTHYAEDYLTGAAGGGSKSDELTQPISFRQSLATADAAGSGFAGQWHRDRSLFGATLEQLYVQATDSFYNIELTIRGDPFWLGQTDVDRSFALRGQAVYASPNVPSGTQPTATGTLDPQTGAIATQPGFRPNWFDGDQTFLLTFRYPMGIGEAGQPTFRAGDNFDGVYRTIRVAHSFSGGLFKQTLSAMRMPLIDLLRATGALDAPPEPSSSTGLA